MRTITLEQLIHDMRGRIDSAGNTLDKFMENLGQNPAYAFEWSDSAFTAAANKTVALTVITWLEERPADMDAQTQLLRASTDFMRSALLQLQYPASSTSQPSNLMKQRLAAAQFEMSKYLDQFSLIEKKKP